jgi:hypothetical protein
VSTPLIPRQRGIERESSPVGGGQKEYWIPAFAGMTKRALDSRFHGNDKMKAAQDKFYV